MEINTLTIPIYNWGITIYSNVYSENDKNALKSHLESIEVDERIIEDISRNLKKYNSGNHLCNTEKQLAYLIFSPIYNELGFWRIVPHEIDHLVTKISETQGLDLESRGYISGFIYESLYQLGVLDNLKTYASDPVSYGTPIPSLDSEDVLIITDNDLNDTATLDTLLSNIKSTDKINLNSVYKSTVTVYTGRLGFLVIKDRYGYSEDTIKSYISSIMKVYD